MALKTGAGTGEAATATGGKAWPPATFQLRLRSLRAVLLKGDIYQLTMD